VTLLFNKAKEKKDKVRLELLITNFTPAFFCWDSNLGLVWNKGLKNKGIVKT
jgi:hypothetical protein